MHDDKLTKEEREAVDYWRRVNKAERLPWLVALALSTEGESLVIARYP